MEHRNGMLLAAIASAIAIFFWRKQYRKRGSEKIRSTPPGPDRRLPLLGNVLDFPLERAWLTFERWRERYGEINYARVLGKSILILNSMGDIKALLEKRYDSYSDRPIMTMVGTLMGLDNSVPLLQYGESWRRHRKMAHIALNSEAVKKYHRVQEDVAVLLLEGLLSDPASFDQQVRLAAGRIIISVTYGLPVTTPDDVYITDAERTMIMIGKAMLPGAYLVDLMPALARIPRWVPFLSYQRIGDAGRDQIENMVSRPFHHVKREMERGTARASFTASMLESSEGKDDEHVVKWVAGAMYGAGGESTYATVLSFIWAMCINPAVQDKAQQELDKIVPPSEHRLPSLLDREHLPYVNALVKETLRWRPALPLGIARQTSRADVYRGYSIPRGTVVLPNVWALARDDVSGFPSEEFIPERFLAAQTPLDPASYAFGFGRRICPGKALAENSLFFLIAGILSTLRVERGSDTQAVYTNGLVSWPTEFRPHITGRSQAAVRAIHERANACL